MPGSKKKKEYQKIFEILKITKKKDGGRACGNFLNKNINNNFYHNMKDLITHIYNYFECQNNIWVNL